MLDAYSYDSVMKDVNSRNLIRPRFVRFTDEDDQELERLAAEDGSNVSVMIRRAAVQLYNLPSGGRKTSARDAKAGVPVEQERGTARDVTQAPSAPTNVAAVSTSSRTSAGAE